MLFLKIDLLVLERNGDLTVWHIGLESFFQAHTPASCQCLLVLQHPRSPISLYSDHQERRELDCDLHVGTPVKMLSNIKQFDNC